LTAGGASIDTKMGLFNLFRKKKNRRSRRARSAQAARIKLKETIEKARTDIDRLQAQAQAIGVTVDQHSKQLSDHARLIDEHATHLSSLEQTVSQRATNPGLGGTSQAGRSDQASSPALTTAVIASPSSQKLDVNCFSEQEKRILAVFFQNQGMTLSYNDIAKAMGKSPHTIKNQIGQMRLKADLFDRTVGDESRNRFRLKEGLRIEKYLNVGQPTSRPASTIAAVQSSNPD
jgi:hypothetical protein